MRLRILVLILVVLTIVLPLPTHGGNEDCGGAPPVRLSTGEIARTSLHNRAGSILRENPGERFRRTGTLRAGSMLHVVSGPVCSDSMQWWQVRTINGAEGWLGEGDEGYYQLEPWSVSLEIAYRNSTTVDLVRINASDASVSKVDSFLIKPITGRVGAVFPLSERVPFETLFRQDREHCPAILKPFGAVQSSGDLPADTGLLDTYPSPDGKQLLVVRHLWRSLPNCAVELSAVYGIDRLSLITSGYERTLLNIPANALAPLYLDRFDYHQPNMANTTDSPNNRIEGVWWSPDSTRVLLLIRYADLRDSSAPVFLFKVQVYDLRTDSLTDLGDGLHPSWDVTGERVQWFRRINARPGVPSEEILYTANADGSDLRSIPLPNTVSFTPAQPYDQVTLPWNNSGKRVLGCIQSDTKGCVMAVSFDVADRKLPPPFKIDPALQSGGYHDVKWLDDSTLLWLPADLASMTMYAQNMQTGAIRPIRFKAGASMHLKLADAIPFADGKSVLVSLLPSDNKLNYVVVNIEAATVTAVKMP